MAGEAVKDATEERAQVHHPLFGVAGRAGSALPFDRRKGVWSYSGNMARVTIRSTYALDVDTVRALEDVARRWRVSKSEALRRAIRAVAGRDSSSSNPALDALDELQRSLKPRRDQVLRWADRVRSERRPRTPRTFAGS
jgi:hypothetical protein